MMLYYKYSVLICTVVLYVATLALAADNLADCGSGDFKVNSIWSNGAKGKIYFNHSRFTMTWSVNVNFTSPIDPTKFIVPKGDKVKCASPTSCSFTVSSWNPLVIVGTKLTIDYEIAFNRTTTPTIAALGLNGVRMCGGPPVNGNWGSWTDSTSCSKTCGGGTMTQTRVCNHPTPAYGGNSCPGSSSQTVNCNINPCPVNGNWGAWTESSSCTVTCGGGTKTLVRVCNNPEPANGGRTCPGSSTDTVACNTDPCPVFSKVLVALGWNGGGIADVEIIDLLPSKTTCKKPQNFPYGNWFASGGLGFQDKPLICGGNPNNSSACHHYEDGTWKSSNSLKQVRDGFAVTKSPFQDGRSKLFLTGGYGQSSSLNSSEVLTENGWQVSVTLPFTISHHGMVTVNSTSVIVVGGYQNNYISGKSFIFNSERNIWTEGKTLKKARIHHSCGSIRRDSQTKDKSLIAVGGHDGSTYLRSVEVLDLDSNSWREGPYLPVGISLAAMVEDPSGGVVLIGGESDGIGVLDTLYRLPHAGSDATWELMPQKLKTKRTALTAFLIPDDIAACN